jgi:hypothetical protein
VVVSTTPSGLTGTTTGASADPVDNPPIVQNSGTVALMMTFWLAADWAIAIPELPAMSASAAAPAKRFLIVSLLSL